MPPLIMGPGSSITGKVFFLVCLEVNKCGGSSLPTDTQDPGAFLTSLSQQGEPSNVRSEDVVVFPRREHSILEFRLVILQGHPASSRQVKSSLSLRVPVPVLSFSMACGESGIISPKSLSLMEI